MLQKSTLQFLKDLKKNNSKEWFDANRVAYDAAKKDFTGFIEKLLPKIALFDPEIAEVKAKDCLFRINRDVRFSKDKAPYKSNFGAAISFKGRKSTYPGYYVHIEPGNSVVGGGAYFMMPDELQKVRQEIDYNSKEFLKIIKSKKFISVYGEIKGERLVNPPKGFHDNEMAMQYLKYKQWYAMTPAIPDTEIVSPSLEKTVLDAFKTLRPLNVFFQQAMAT